MNFGFLSVGPIFHLAVMVDYHISQLEPVFFREKFHQILFNFVWVAMFGEPAIIGELADMGVNRDSLYNSVSVAKNNVRGFAGNAGQLNHFGHSFWQLPAKIALNHFAGVYYIFCFRAVKSGRFYFLFKPRAIGTGEIARGFIFFEKFFRNLVHFFVGTLRRKYHRNQKLDMVAVIKPYFGIRIKFFKPFQNFGGFFFFVHIYILNQKLKNPEGLSLGNFYKIFSSSWGSFVLSLFTLPVCHSSSFSKTNFLFSYLNPRITPLNIPPSSLSTLNHSAYS